MNMKKDYGYQEGLILMSNLQQFKECQDCKKVFKIPKPSMIFNQHSCPFCESWNTGYIDKKLYKQNYNTKLYNQG